MEQTPNIKYYGRPQGRGIKLHLGCGDYWFDGYTNIDHQVFGGTDMIWDLRKGIPFQPEVVEIIEAYELLEHFNRDEAFVFLEECKRVLINGGKIKISVPDFDGLVNMYTLDPEEALKMIYGFVDNPGHKDGYTQNKLKKLFEDHGFKNVIVEKGHLPERPTEPQLLLEAEK